MPDVFITQSSRTTSAICGGILARPVSGLKRWPCFLTKGLGAEHGPENRVKPEVCGNSGRPANDDDPRTYIHLAFAAASDAS